MPPSEATREALRSIYRETWPAAYGALLGVETLGKMLRELEDPSLSALLADGTEMILFAYYDDDTVPVGAAITRAITLANGTRSALVWGLYVRPSAQRRGVGRGLMAEVERRMPDVDRIDLSVLTANTGTFEFYERLGFGPIHLRDRAPIMPGVEAPVVEMMKPRGQTPGATHVSHARSPFASP